MMKTLSFGSVPMNILSSSTCRIMVRSLPLGLMRNTKTSSMLTVMFIIPIPFLSLGLMRLFILISSVYATILANASMTGIKAFTPNFLMVMLMICPSPFAFYKMSMKKFASDSASRVLTVSNNFSATVLRSLNSFFMLMFAYFLSVLFLFLLI